MPAQLTSSESHSVSLPRNTPMIGKDHVNNDPREEWRTGRNRPECEGRLDKTLSVYLPAPWTYMKTKSYVARYKVPTQEKGAFKPTRSSPQPVQSESSKLDISKPRHVQGRTTALLSTVYTDFLLRRLLTEAAKGSSAEKRTGGRNESC